MPEPHPVASAATVGDSFKPPARASRPHVSKDENEKRRQHLAEQRLSVPLMSPKELAAITVDMADVERLNEVLLQHGCALVSNVLSPEEVSQLEDLWTRDLQAVADAKAPCRDWQASWQRPLGSKGCASQQRLPQGAFAWTARLHPNVRQVFSHIYETPTDELATGTDVVFFQSRDAEAAPDNLQWMHVDQNHRSGLTHLCYQGVLYVWPSTDERASTTALWPGSHTDVFDRLMADGFAQSKARKGHASQSVQINSLWDCYDREELAQEAFQRTRRVPCPAGSLLLWDSRLLHQGWNGGPRLAQPVCWEPRSRRDDAARRRKLYFCTAGVATSHSPSEGRIHGMCRRRPWSAKGRAGAPGCTPQVPYCIAPAKQTDWEALEERLWAHGDTPEPNAAALTEAQARDLESLLRPEVAAAL